MLLPKPDHSVLDKTVASFFGGSGSDVCSRILSDYQELDMAQRLSVAGRARFKVGSIFPQGQRLRCATSKVCV